MKILKTHYKSKKTLLNGYPGMIFLFSGGEGVCDVTSLKPLPPTSQVTHVRSMNKKTLSIQTCRFKGELEHNKN